jgi:hypothetical protein
MEPNSLVNNNIESTAMIISYFKVEVSLDKYLPRWLCHNVELNLKDHFGYQNFKNKKI